MGNDMDPASTPAAPVPLQAVPQQIYAYTPQIEMQPADPSKLQVMAAPSYPPPAEQYAGSAATADPSFDPTGKYKLVFKGAFAAVEAAVSMNDGIKTETGAMVTMSNNVDLQVKMDGGFGASCMRCCCAGESLFMTHFNLKPGAGPRGDILLAPAVPGEIQLLTLNGTTSWSIQKASYLAADQQLTIGTRMQSMSQGCCSGEGFFIMEASGHGRLLINSYGSMVRYDLQQGEQRKIDNGCLVAWTSNMPYEMTTATGSLMSSFLSGEGFVCRFTGPGTVFCQTHSIKSLADALVPYLPAQRSSN